MSDLPLREGIGWDVSQVRPIHRDRTHVILDAYADGILRTRGEWSEHLDLQAAVNHLEWCRGLRISIGMMAELIDAAETGEWGADDE